MAVQGIRLAGLWAKQTKNGETYHEGSLGGCNIRIFVNGYKKKESDPDVILYISQKPKPDERVQNYRREQQAVPTAQPQKSRITPRPQAQQAPPKPAYKDWTKAEGPPDDGMPWPEGENEPPF